MRWQTTAVLAVIFAALVGFYYWYEVRLGPERERAEARKGRVFTADPADVTEIAIKRANDTVRLKREGDAWQMVEPLTARGDRGTIDSTLTSIVTAKMDREVAENPPSLADFGLDNPVADVTLTLKDGKQLGLALGGKNPTGVWVYARERDKPSVFVLGEAVLRDATRPVADFRDKTILAFDRADVTGLDLVLRDDTLALEKQDTTWRLTRPRALPADAETVGDFLDKLRTARVKEFVAEAPRSLEPYGLERPIRVSVHTGKDKDRAVRTIHLGRFDEKKQGIYAMRPDEASVLLLPEDIWKDLPKTVASVRDKTVMAFEWDKVKRVEVDSPRGQVTLVREDNRWKITRPEDLPADQTEAGAILSKLRGLKAQAFISEEAAGVARYLGKPEVRLTLTEEGAEPKTLLLAPAPDKRGGQPMAYAALQGGSQVVLVDAAALTDLGRSLNEWRDRTLFSGLEPKDVHRLQVKRDGKSVLVEREDEDEWEVLEPEERSARRARVDDVLYGVRALKWKEIVSPNGEDLAKYGLDAPSAEVALYKKDGSELAVVHLGRREGDLLYIKTKASPAVYAIDGKSFDLPKVPDDFLG